MDLPQKYADVLFRNSLKIDDGLVFYEGGKEFGKEGLESLVDGFFSGNSVSCDACWNVGDNIMDVMTKSYESLLEQISCDTAVNQLMTDNNLVAVVPFFDEFLDLCDYEVLNTDGEVTNIGFDDFVERMNSDLIGGDIKLKMPFDLFSFKPEDLSEQYERRRVVQTLTNKKELVESFDLERYKAECNARLKMKFPGTLEIKDNVLVYDDYKKMFQDGIIPMDDPKALHFQFNPCLLKLFQRGDLKIEDGRERYRLMPKVDVLNQAMYRAGIDTAVRKAKEINDRSVAVLIKPRFIAYPTARITGEYSDGRNFVSIPPKQVNDVLLKSYLQTMEFMFQLVLYKTQHYLGKTD